MRAVRAAHPPPEDAELPSREALEAVRGLGQRYASIGVREVVLVRFGGDSKHRRWLALESMQITGSFKVRGALHAVERRIAAAKAGGRTERLSLVAVSAGNHGAGVAFAAKHLDAEAVIVVPRGAPRTKVSKMIDAGATVIEAASAGYDDAEREALALAKDRKLPFLSPYDDLDVLVGNGASLAFEIVQKLGRVPELVHCPIGGGGLATGLACGFEHEAGGAGRRARVVPVQSEASAAFATSLETGVAVTELPPATTLAEGLEGGISARAFARASAVIERALVCTEEEIERAMRYAVRELGLVLEGSAAVALTAALERNEAGRPGLESDTVFVLTGRNVDTGRLAAC